MEQGARCPQPILSVPTAFLRPLAGAVSKRPVGKGNVTGLESQIWTPSPDPATYRLVLLPQDLAQVVPSSVMQPRPGALMPPGPPSSGLLSHLRACPVTSWQHVLLFLWGLCLFSLAACLKVWSP